MQHFEQEWLRKSLPVDQNELLAHVGTIHGELLFIHLFREGNGRTARLLANLMLEQQGRERLRWELIDGVAFPRYVAAVQQSGFSNYAPMQALIRSLYPS